LEGYSRPFKSRRTMTRREIIETSKHYRNNRGATAPAGQ
jgi:hypothetical protein